MGGFVGGAASGACIGSTWVLWAACGAAGGAAASLTTDLINTGQVNGTHLAEGVAFGAVGGVVGGKLFNGQRQGVGAAGPDRLHTGQGHLQRAWSAPGPRQCSASLHEARLPTSDRWRSSASIGVVIPTGDCPLENAARPWLDRCVRGFCRVQEQG